METPAASTQRPRRHALAVELTSYCNQRCGYCYNAWRDDGGSSVGALPADELAALVDRALAEVAFEHVTFTGGEPFARADVWSVFDVCRRRGVPFQLISNGGLVTDAIAERLAPYRPGYVQITLNGPERELHERHVGRGHFDRTISGIDALVRRGVRVAGCIVVTRRNAGVVGEVLALFRAHGVDTIALSRYSPAGFAAREVADLLPSRTDMIAALAQAEADARAYGTDVQVTMPVPPCVVEHADYPRVKFGGCPIGTEAQELALGPRGELRNCTLHAEELGDARTTSFATLVEDPRIAAYRDVTSEFCAPCPHRRTCLGGCGAAAATVLGDPRGLDPFVAQHVDPAFRARLAAARDGFVAASSLRR